jgi:hypothetical protein
MQHEQKQQQQQPAAAAAQGTGSSCCTRCWQQGTCARRRSWFVSIISAID